MTISWFGSAPGGYAAVSLAVEFCVGTALGVVYFRGLLWNARLLAEGARLRVAVGLGVGRFVLLSGILTLAGLCGAMPLLVVALGIMVGRFAVMRSVRNLTR